MYVLCSYEIETGSDLLKKRNVQSYSRNLHISSHLDNLSYDPFSPFLWEIWCVWKQDAIFQEFSVIVTISDFFLPSSPLRFLVISRDARNSYYFMESACFLAPPELWSLDLVVNIDDQSTFSFFGWPSMTVPLPSSFFSYFAITTVYVKQSHPQHVT